MNAEQQLRVQMSAKSGGGKTPQSMVSKPPVHQQVRSQMLTAPTQQTPGTQNQPQQPSSKQKYINASNTNPASYVDVTSTSSVSSAKSNGVIVSGVMGLRKEQQ